MGRPLATAAKAALCSVAALLLCCLPSALAQPTITLPTRPIAADPYYILHTNTTTRDGGAVQYVRRYPTGWPSIGASTAQNITGVTFNITAFTTGTMSAFGITVRTPSGTVVSTDFGLSGTVTTATRNLLTLRELFRFYGVSNTIWVSWTSLRVQVPWTGRPPNR
jgi:hypothetical protein